MFHFLPQFDYDLTSSQANLANSYARPLSFYANIDQEASESERGPRISNPSATISTVPGSSGSGREAAYYLDLYPGSYGSLRTRPYSFNRQENSANTSGGNVAYEQHFFNPAFLDGTVKPTLVTDENGFLIEGKNLGFEIFGIYYWNF